MAQYNIDKITASKYGDGDRWRIAIGQDWYDLYADFGDDGPPQAPVTLDLEWRESKSGKQYATILGGPRKAPQARRSNPPPAPSSAPPPSAAPAPSPSAGARPYDSTRDQWILISTIVGHTIDKFGTKVNDDDLVGLAVGAAKAARAAARVMLGANTDAARAAVQAEPEPEPAPRRPAPVQAPAAELGDPEDPRNTGPDFDDDIPF